MFERLYTTKMSADKKSLQKRFTKIRSKSGRLSRLMAIFMSVAVLITITCATIVMAAVGSDGLEHWTTNEIYFRDGIKFTVNVAGENVPDWIFEDVAGTDGRIDVTITRYQTRDIKGQVDNEHLITLSGSIGNVKLASGGWSYFGENLFYDTRQFSETHSIRQYAYISEIFFREFNSPGYEGKRNSPIMSLIDNKKSKQRFVYFYLPADENYNLKTAYIRFLNSDVYDNAIDEDFGIVEAGGELSYIGNFEKDFVKDASKKHTTTNYYFTMYEDNFENNNVEGININVKEATEKNIIIDTNISLPEAKEIDIAVYDNSGRCVSSSARDTEKPIQSRYILTPSTARVHQIISPTDDTTVSINTYSDVEVPENKFVKGDRYRVCIVLFDDENTVLYRWQKYVKLN